MPSRKIEDLHPVVAAKWNRVQQRAKDELNLDLIVTNTLRTEAEQLAYLAQGRKNLRTVNELRKEAGLPPITEKENRRCITWVSTSIHEYGCAVDFAILKPYTRVCEWDPKADFDDDGLPEYEEVGRLAESEGFRWGGRFKKKDYVHVEYTGGLTREELRAGKRPEVENCRNCTHNEVCVFIRRLEDGRVYPNEDCEEMMSSALQLNCGNYRRMT